MIRLSSNAVPWALSDWVFLLTGSFGGAVLAVRILLMPMGWHLDGDPDGDGGEGFAVLSLHGISSFCMMFGLVGLALSRQNRVGPGWALAGAVLAGAGAIWVIARLFRLAAGLQSSGNVRALDAAGCLGTVSESIPARGSGRVNVRMGQRLREMDAIHPDGADVATGTLVRVLRVERSVAVVQPLTSTESPCSTT